MTTSGLVGLGVLGLLFLGGAHAQTSVPDGWDGDRLLVLVDADMAATGYADGELHPIEGSSDQLVMISMKSGQSRAVDAPVLNTVMGWPGSMVVTADGAKAYVVSSRDAVDRSIQSFKNGVFEEMPVADRLTAVDLRTGSILSETSVCKKPMSVDLAPSGSWLLVACGDTDGELAIVPLNGASVGTPESFDLDVPDFAEREMDAGATYAVIHPAGEAAAVVLNNRAVALVRFALSETGLPEDATAEPPTATDRWLAMARWTKTGDHLLVADTGWGPSPLDAVFNRNSDIVSFALSPGDEQRGEVSTARVSKSPEAFEINRAGDLLAVVNMERTYLPGGMPTGLFRKRNASSLSLVAVDDASGALTTLGKPIKFRGVLPEDAVFDADGDRIAVVVFQDHGSPRSDGWITFFELEGQGDARRASETDFKIDLPRGGHDLFVID